MSEWQAKQIRINEAEIERLRGELRGASDEIEWQAKRAEAAEAAERHHAEQSAEWFDRWKAAEARTAKLVEALEHFGRHDEDCTNIPADGGRPRQHCDCGLDAVMASEEKS